LFRRRDAVLKTADRICNFILQPREGGEKGAVSSVKNRIWVPECNFNSGPLPQSKPLERETAPLGSFANAVMMKGRPIKLLPPIEHSASPIDSKQVSSRNRVFFLGTSTKVHVDSEIAPIASSKSVIKEHKAHEIPIKNERMRLPCPSRQDMMRILNVHATFAEALAIDYNLASCSFLCAPEAKAASRQQIISVLIKLVQTMCVFVSGNPMNQKTVYKCLEVESTFIILVLPLSLF